MSVDDTLKNLGGLLEKQNQKKEEKTKGAMKNFFNPPPAEEEEEEEKEKNNTFVLGPKKKPALERKTYYLTPSLIETIDEVSGATGYDKSEVVRMALQTFFDNIDIKKSET